MIYARGGLFGAIGFGFVLLSSQAMAACAVPNVLTNGQIADASQVMGNFNAVASCADAVSDEAVSTTGSPNTGGVAVFSGSDTITSGNLSGDVTTSGNTATTLSPTGVAAGIYINPKITVDAKGRLTAVETVPGSSGGGGGLPSHPPSTALFSFSANGASANSSTVDGSKYFLMAATDTGVSGQERVRFRGKQVPAGTWSATMGFKLPIVKRSSYVRVGLALHNSASGRTLDIGYNSQANAPAIASFYFSNLTTYSSIPFKFEVLLNVPREMFVKIGWDGSNYILSYSLDEMENWITAGVLPAASYFTADYVGVMINSYGAILPEEGRMSVFYYSDPDFLAP